MAKDSFILYTEQKEVVNKLTDEQAGKLIKAIYEYVSTEKMPELDPLLDIAITPIKQNIDKNADKYEEVKRKKSEAGKIGAEIKKQKQANANFAKQTVAKQANANFAKQTVANQAVNVNDNVNVNVNDDDNNNNVVVGDSCVDGLQDVIDFYNDNIGLITPYGLEVLSDYAKEMSYDVIIYAMQKAVEANIRTIQYIKGTLNNWQKAGVKNLIQAKEESRNFKKGKSEPVKGETEEEAIARKTRELEEAMKNDKW